MPRRRVGLVPIGRMGGGKQQQGGGATRTCTIYKQAPPLLCDIYYYQCDHVYSFLEFCSNNMIIFYVVGMSCWISPSPTQSLEKMLIGENIIITYFRVKKRSKEREEN